jgi:hypothetical protein
MASILPGWNLAGRNAPGSQTGPFETTDLRQIQGFWAINASPKRGHWSIFRRPFE